MTLVLFMPLKCLHKIFLLSSFLFDLLLIFMTMVGVPGIECSRWKQSHSSPGFLECVGFTLCWNGFCHKEVLNRSKGKVHGYWNNLFADFRRRISPAHPITKLQKMFTGLCIRDYTDYLRWLLTAWTASHCSDEWLAMCYGTSVICFHNISVDATGDL